jgi:hypothetical protein
MEDVPQPACDYEVGDALVNIVVASENRSI